MHYIGVITRGSLERGIEMKLHPDESIEKIAAGTFVVIEGRDFEFFSMITDVTLDAGNDEILLNPPDESEELLLRVLQGAAIFTTVKLKPMLMVKKQTAISNQQSANGAASDVSINDDWSGAKSTPE